MSEKREGGHVGLMMSLRFFPELCSPSAGEQPALFTLSPKATTASSFTTWIFTWVAPFTLLNSVTASSCEFKNKALAQFWAVKGVLLRSVCQQPIKANSTGQAVHSAIEGFSQNAHWQDIEGCYCGMTRGYWFLLWESWI